MNGTEAVHTSLQYGLVVSAGLLVVLTVTAVGLIMTGGPACA